MDPRHRHHGGKMLRAGTGNHYRKFPISEIASEGKAKTRGNDGRIAATIVNPPRFPARLLFYASSAAAAAAFVVISWRCDF